MSKMLIIACLLTFTSLVPTFAQKEKSNDWIILNNGSKVYGKVNFKSTKKASEKCEFTASNQSKKIYYPSDIQYYSIYNFKQYKAASVVINGQTRKVFLEKMVDGVVDLYYIKGDDQTSYYIEKEDQLISLKSKKDTSYLSQGQLYQKREEPFKKTLYSTLSKAPSLLSQVNHIKYDQKDLVKIVTNYHNLTCDSIKCIDYTAIIKNRKKIAIELGGLYIQNTFKSAPETSTSIAPHLGVTLAINTAKSGYKNYFKTGLFFNTNKINQRYTLKFRSQFDRFIDFTESYTNISMPIMVGKNIATKNAILNLEFGILNNYFIYKTFGHKIYAVDFIGRIDEQVSNETTLKKPYKTGLEAGVFLNKNRLIVGASFGFRTTVPKFGYYTEFLNNLYINPKIGFVIN